MANPAFAIVLISALGLVGGPALVSITNPSGLTDFASSTGLSTEHRHFVVNEVWHYTADSGENYTLTVKDGDTWGYLFNTQFQINARIVPDLREADTHSIAQQVFTDYQLDPTWVSYRVSQPIGSSDAVIKGTLPAGVLLSLNDQYKNFFARYEVEE